jgi:hypothetical protein
VHIEMALLSAGEYVVFLRESVSASNPSNKSSIKRNLEQLGERVYCCLLFDV